MSIPDPKKAQAFRQFFMKYPDGITISEFSSKMKMNRNLAAKNLDFLVLSGQLQMKSVGSAKLYSLSSRVPISGLVNFSNDLVILLDSGQRITRVNDQVSARLDERPEALIGKKIDEIGNPFFRSLSLVLKPLSPGESKREKVEISCMVHGEPHHYNLNQVQVVFEDGTPGTALILHNITAEKKYQQICDVHEVFLQSMDEDQSEFVIRFLPDGTFTFMNPVMSRFFNRKNGETPGFTLRSAILVEDLPLLDRVFTTINREHPVQTLRCRFVNPQGQIRQFNWTLRGLFTPDNANLEYLGTGMDITEQQTVVEKVHQLLAGQALLYQTSFRFTELPKDADIFETIGKGVKECLPDAIVAVNEYIFDTATVDARTRCFLGDRDRELFSQAIGRDVVGMNIEACYTPEIYHLLLNLLGGKILKVPCDMYIMFQGKIPQEICQKIEESLNIGDMYAIGLVSQNVIFGNVVIMLRKEEVMEKHENIEIFIKLATLALKCRFLEEGRKISPSVPWIIDRTSPSV